MAMSQLNRRQILILKTKYIQTEFYTEEVSAHTMTTFYNSRSRQRKTILLLTRKSHSHYLYVRNKTVIIWSTKLRPLFYEADSHQAPISQHKKTAKSKLWKPLLYTGISLIFSLKHWANTNLAYWHARNYSCTPLNS